MSKQKNKVLSIRVDVPTYADILVKADKQNLSVSAYLEKAILTTSKGVNEKSKTKPLENEIKALKSKINSLNSENLNLKSEMRELKSGINKETTLKGVKKFLQSKGLFKNVKSYTK